MNSVLFTSGEALPYIKTGGLADVMGAAPKELVRKGVDARVIIPLYGKVLSKFGEALAYETTINVPFNGQDVPAAIYSTVSEGVKCYFVQNQGYFEREQAYGYDDDNERFAFYMVAVCEMMAQMDYFPDVVHNNDWQTGMIPFLCRTKYASDERYANMKQVMMIHNLAYQGNCSADMLDMFGVDRTYFDNGTIKMYDGISYMKAGIMFADKVMTVSDTYAKEIMTEEYGQKMEKVLQMRANDVCGVVNGIDVDLWNPETDPLLVKNYSKASVLDGKAANKKAIQEELGLRVDPNVLLVGMVSRLTWQKGVYLMSEKMSDIMGLDIQVVILGTGEGGAEYNFREMENKYKRRAVYYRGYNEDLAHRIYAGSDLFLMPSLFEPCGISQLISMHYGCLPVVRETGGLKDTVAPYNQFTGEGTGFSFANFDANEFYGILRYIADVFYTDKAAWNKLIEQAMDKDVSWEHSVNDYINIYNSL